MRQLAAALLALTAVLSSHSMYYLWPADSVDRVWAKYVGDGAGFALMCVALIVLADGVAGAILVGLGTWGFIEGAQQYGCGLASWGATNLIGADLCIALMGRWPYTIVAIVVIVWIAHSIYRTRKK